MWSWDFEGQESKPIFRVTREVAHHAQETKNVSFSLAGIKLGAGKEGDKKCKIYAQQWPLSRVTKEVARPERETED